MKIDFDKKGRDFLEIRKETSGQIAIIISAQDPGNSLNTIINCVIITEQQLLDLLKSLDLSSLTL